MTNSKINSALDFFKKEDYKKALDLFNEALIDDENNQNIINNIALCEMKLGKQKEAEEHFLKAISIEPKTPQPYLNLAELYFTQNELLKAIELLQTASSLIPNDVAILHYLARIYIEDKRLEEGIDALNLILDISPENIDAYWDLGMLHFDMGEYEIASRNFENVLEKVQNNPIIYYQTALSYEMQNNIDKAISNHLKAITVNEKFPLSYKRLGMLYMARGEAQDAAEYFEDYLKFDISEDEKSAIKKNIEKLKNSSSN